MDVHLMVIKALYPLFDGIGKSIDKGTQSGQRTFLFYEMETHCQCCYANRHRPRSSDQLVGNRHDSNTLVAKSLRENRSFPWFAADGCWFGRTSVPDAADVGLTTSFRLGSPGIRSSMMPSLTSGGLVCPPAVPTPPFGDILGDAHLGNTNVAPADNRCAHEADQAPRRWYENTTVLEGLVSAFCLKCI
ncbi:hypothetical protein HD806DRAFT_80952 [Xylariaceae sp. AK1471]|nr:hypothetical protein HD806DRAFT_80952 [Xylariaceae sp. AK1471]